MEPAIVEQINGEKLQASTAKDKKANDDIKSSQKTDTDSGASKNDVNSIFYAASRNHVRQRFKLEDRMEKTPKRLKQYK